MPGWMQLDGVGMNVMVIIIVACASTRGITERFWKSLLSAAFGWIKACGLGLWKDWFSSSLGSGSEGCGREGAWKGLAWWESPVLVQDSS